jgi:hypothetical protein
MRNASAQEMRLFYRAAIAFMDSLVGTLLDELDLTGLADETAVIFHSDHGFMLGENGEWKKFTLTELGTRVPLIARVPWMPHTAGTRTSALVELIDVMPTLADLAGLPPPAVAPGDAPLDGTSMLPLFGVTPPTSLKTHVLSQYPRCPTNTTVPQLLWRTNLCINTPSSEFGWMGYSLRTDEWSASILLDAAGCNCVDSLLRSRPRSSPLYSPRACPFVSLTTTATRCFVFLNRIHGVVPLAWFDTPSDRATRAPKKRYEWVLLRAVPVSARQQCEL